MRVCLLFALLLLSYSLLAQSPSTGELKKTFPPDQRSEMKRDLIVAQANLNWQKAEKSAEEQLTALKLSKGKSKDGHTTVTRGR